VLHIRRAEVQAAGIDVDAILAEVSLPGAGATALFRGDVRDHDHGRAVVRLDYQGHPTAAAVLDAVAQDVAARHDVLALVVVHRVGELEVGEAALVAAVSSVHRAEAFAACAELVEETKRALPVWKRQVFADGTDEWVNCA
jgi:molybdopterin synthase catalytic subunit